MLRKFVLAVAILSLLGAGFALLAGATPGFFVLGAWGAILLFGTIYERVLYKPLLPRGTAPGVRTPERFVDDATGKTVTVYVDPVSGERSYAEE